MQQAAGRYFVVSKKFVFVNLANEIFLPLALFLLFGECKKKNKYPIDLSMFPLTNDMNKRPI